jgi:putative ABC transport system permease protein
MFNDLGKQAYSALRHNRRRSLLTMLGMAWGIATVVLLLAYGSGFQNALMIAFRTFGGNLVAVFPGRTSLQAGGSKAGTQIRLTREDMAYLRDEVPMIKRMSPEVDKQSALVVYGTRSASYTARGTLEDDQEIRIRVVLADDDVSAVEITNRSQGGDARDHIRRQTTEDVVVSKGARKVRFGKK